MKQIQEYLSTKVKNNNAIELSEFPESYKLSDITNFLDDHNFEKLEAQSFDTLYDVLGYIKMKCNAKHYPAYIISKHQYGNDYRWIRMWNGPCIDREHPILFMIVTDDGHVPAERVAGLFAIENSANRIKSSNHFDDLKEYVKKYLKI